MKKRTSLRQKVWLVVFGCLAAVVLLEVGMRAAGGIISAVQSYQNLPDAHEDGHYRILCLGESTTFFGSYNHAYPALLEKDLNGRQLGHVFRVYNEGHIGTDSDEILEDLRDNLQQYRPHMVIVMMGVNDGIGVDAQRAAQAGNRGGLRVIRLLAHVQRHWAEKFRPGYRRALIERGYRRLSDGDADTARKIAARARKAGLPLAEVEALTGHIFWLADGDFDQAIAAYEKALSHDDGREWLYEDFFQVLYYGQRYEEAAALMRRMLERFPRSEDGFRNLAKLYLQMKEYVKLKSVLKQAQEQVPGDPVMLRIRAAYHLARGEKQMAEESYRRYADYERQNLNPRTTNNYRRLRDAVAASGARLVAVQYPLRDVGTLQAMLEDDPGVVFVANRDNFKNAVTELGYGHYFTDQFAGDFGHMSEAGNRLLAATIAEAVARHAPKR